MYSYMADAGWFVDCLTGQRLPVAQVADNAVLEAAYTKARSIAGAPMLATLDAHVEDRSVIVDKFISIAPEGCSGPSSTAELVNTYWKLMTLGGVAVETPEAAREIHFVLDRENLRLRGFTGCNTLSGTYRLDGEKLEFTDVASTMMACEGDMSLEPRVHEMFAQVAGWAIAGETLQLSDGNGTVLAMFESRYMK